MANTNDLRYVRTEKAIRTAFLELVSERNVKKVSASDICKRAGVSRNAFYLHHNSVSELYTALVRELVDDVRVECVTRTRKWSETREYDDIYEAIIGSLARHEELLRVLLPADDGTLAKRLALGMDEAFVEAALQFGGHGASFEHELRCSYSAWALVGFVQRWISGTDRPLDESLESFRELLESVVESSGRYLLAKGHE